MTYLHCNMSQPTIAKEGAQRLDKFTAGKVDDGTVPLLYTGVANKDEIVYFNQAGTRLDGKPELVDESSGEYDEDQLTLVLQLFSMTKLVTSIACIQLAEKGLVRFDDPAVIEKHLPELWAVPILVSVSDDGEVRTRPRTKPITLRHLLTHTAGLAYSFASPLLAKWEAATNAPGWLTKGADVAAITQPLVFEPGTDYTYSIALDWAGLLVVRVTGQTLEDYFHDHIFGPIGISRDDITFLPSDKIRHRMTDLYTRDPNTGKVILATPQRPIQEWNPEDIDVQMGGAGLLGTAKAYLTFLSNILKCKDQDGFISRNTFELLFTNALPERDSEYGPAIYKSLGAMADFEGIKQLADGTKVSHSLGLMLFETDGLHGRKAGTGCWSGAARTRFWIDPVSGIVGFCGTQIFDVDWIHFAKVVDEFETEVYKVLQ